MNCPGAMLVYKTHLHSYRDLPLRLAELGLVHRHELSGGVSGLFRVRNFTQDDAHIFVTPEQLESEIIKAQHHGVSAETSRQTLANIERVFEVLSIPKKAYLNLF